MWQMTHKYRHMTRLQCDTNHILEFQSPFIEFDNSNIFNRIVAAWLEYVFGCVANNISQFKNYQKIICRKINSKCIPSSTDIIPRQPLLSSTHVKKVIFDRNWWFYILKCILRLNSEKYQNFHSQAEIVIFESKSLFSWKWQFR